MAFIKNIPWGRLTLEALVVVGSVYLAIALEGASDDRARETEALAALSTLHGELVRDRADLAVIIEAQEDRLVRHERIERWLSSVGPLPGDSVSQDLYVLFSVNRTMFPRNSAWTTMVASGQLTDLDGEAPVARLADFYENRSERLVYNGALYDNWVQAVARDAVPASWDRIAGRLATSSQADVNRFRAELLGLSDLGGNFVALLTEWGAELDEVIAEVDRYLTRHGAGTP